MAWIEELYGWVDKLLENYFWIYLFADSLREDVV